MIPALLLLLLHGPDDAARRRSAIEHEGRGKKLYEAERFEQALEEFKVGYSTYPLPGFLINIGQTYRQLGLRKKAITLYQQYLDLQPEDDSLRPQVQRMIDELELEERAAEHVPPPKPKADLAPKPPPEPPPVARVETHEEPPPPPPKGSPWYGKWWVWTLAGVVVAGGVAAGVAATSSSSGGISPGSLGLLDGR
jgi:tetratricopeptide (TPR) repeat protein